MDFGLMDKLNLADAASVDADTTGAMVLMLPVNIEIVDGKITKSEIHGDLHIGSSIKGRLSFVRRNPEDRGKYPNWPAPEPIDAGSCGYDPATDDPRIAAGNTWRTNNAKAK